MAITIEHLIKNSINAITNETSYKTWLKEIKNLAEDDIVVLNNSFIYRDVSTNKSDRCLGFSLFSNGKIKEYYILYGQNHNADFKHISYKNSGISKKILSDALKIERKELGELVFILIGVLEDNIEVETQLSSTVIKKIVFNPAFSNTSIATDTIFINETSDEDLIWSEIHKNYTGNPDFDNNEQRLKEEIGRALDTLEGNSYSIVKMPKNISKNMETVTDSLVKMLELQIQEYKAAITKCKGDPLADKQAFNELLRISYNFSSDALTFIRLIISICDLKPIVLWGTLKEHYELSEKFKFLPWLRSKRKPSLSNYKAIIGGARNAAFHNLFPFKRCVDVKLPDKSLRGITLRTFSEYPKRKENQLKFQDKELIDVLIEFTRTNEHKISASFWQKNLDVLIATKNLFETTSSFLKKIRKSN